jgi:LPXTG-site transpeptidase (sortase) family protein
MRSSFFKKLKKAQKKGLSYIFIGLLFVLIFIIWRIDKGNAYSFNVKDTSLKVDVKKGSKPVKLSIPSVKLNLDVKEASIKDGVWQIWEDSANHLDSSANPGGGGNIVIYGHNKNRIFGPIRWLTNGQTIELTDENGKKRIYGITKIVETTPNDINYVLPKSKETLTLYTCSGLFDSKRFIVVAILQEGPGDTS